MLDRSDITVYALLWMSLYNRDVSTKWEKFCRRHLRICKDIKIHLCVHVDVCVLMRTDVAIYRTSVFSLGAIIWCLLSKYIMIFITQDFDNKVSFVVNSSTQSFAMESIWNDHDKTMNIEHVGMTQTPKSKRLNFQCFMLCKLSERNIDHCHNRFICGTGLPTRVITVYWSGQVIQKGSFMVIPQLTFRLNRTFYGISYRIRYRWILGKVFNKMFIIIEIYQCRVNQWTLLLKYLNM